MRLWALVTSALRMMKVSPCVGGCHIRGSGAWEMKVWVHCSTRAYGVCLRVDLPVQAGLRGILASGL